MGDHKDRHAGEQVKANEEVELNYDMKSAINKLLRFRRKMTEGLEESKISLITEYWHGLTLIENKGLYLICFYP